MRLDMGRSLVEVDIEPGASLVPVAEALKAMGYAPRPVTYAAAGKRGAVSKTMLARLGVAGAAAGNIMLLSTSLYSGATETSYAAAFEWLTFALFLPVLLYSAVPFYRNSLAALRGRRSSIDVPIAAAVVAGTGIGFYHLVVGRGEVYFDSLSVLVFLLLGSRYLLLSLQGRFLSPTHLSAFFAPKRVRVVDNETGEVTERHADTLTWGDAVVVGEGERFPADGRLADGEAWVNSAVLTGEPHPQRVLGGQSVFAGTQLVSGEATILVEKVGSETRVGQLLDETERSVLGRTPLVSLTDRAGQWFSASVLGIALVFVVIYGRVDVHEAIARALALVILACPCALALATPLTQSIALKKASRRGCLIKSAEAFEKLVHVRDVFFDKTGTLTRGELVVAGWQPRSPTELERSIIIALEMGSTHPAGRTLAADVAKHAHRDVCLSDRKEVPGVGVSGRHDGDLYELRAVGGAGETEVSGIGADDTRTRIGLYRNSSLVTVAALADVVRESARGAVETFRKNERDVYLLTGDALGPGIAAGRDAGIAADHVLAAQSPEEKRTTMGRHERALMVGDGVNDSAALASAYVGVAVQGSMETSFRVADIYLTEPGLRPLVDLFALSRATISIIKRNLFFSLAYNTVGATLALAGLITPLIAAVLMPVSSVTVILSSVIGNRFWRRFNQGTLNRSAERAAGGTAFPSLAAKGGGA